VTGTVLERRRQEQVVLEAVPAPPVGHELPLEVGLLQRDRDAAVRVEVLERIFVACARWIVCQVGSSAGSRPIRRMYASKSSIRRMVPLEIPD
jgi:hypothetical protein